MFQKYGSVQIVGIPNFREIRSKALNPLSKCLEADESAFSKVMTDGSRRVSAAALSSDGIIGKISSSCGDTAHELRESIDSTSKVVFNALDSASTISLKESYVMFPYKSFSSLMDKGIQLEHLHSYYPSSKIVDGTSTKEIHVDAGIMIAMTSGFYSNDLSTDMYKEDLLVELPTGEVVKAKTEPDALILLAGNAANQWLSPVLGNPIRAIPHALVVQKDDVKSRSWYGKMFLPPGDAKVPGSEMTYSEFRKKEVDSTLKQQSSSSSFSDSIVPLACDGGNKFGLLSSEVCIPGKEIYCWMMCMKIPANLPCANSSVICFDSKTNQPDPIGDGMCAKTCKLTCPIPTTFPSPVPTDLPTIKPSNPTGNPVVRLVPSTSPSSCFAADELVTLESGVKKRIVDVDIGDRVLAFSSSSEKFVFSDVVYIPHESNNKEATFQQITTTTGKTIKLTPRHLLHSSNYEIGSKMLLLEASRVHPGDCVLTVDGVEKVVFVDSVTDKKGVYSLVTREEFVVVSGMVASPFAINHILPHHFYGIHRFLFTWFPNVLKTKLFKVVGFVADDIAHVYSDVIVSNEF